MTLSGAGMIYLGVGLMSYLVGSFSFAIVLSALFGLPDPRDIGSKNPGATNMLRSGKKLVALLTLLGDAFKGWVCVFLAQNLVITDGLVAVSAVAGFCAFLGHLYPVFFQFKGGKGVATALGIIIGLSPQAAGAAVLFFLVIVLVTRYVSLGSILASIVAGGVIAFSGADVLTQSFVWAMIALLVWRHRTNIRKLLSGQENRVFSKANNAPKC